MKTAQDNVDQGFMERDEALKDLDKRLKQKEWEVQDFKAVQEAKYVFLFNDLILRLHIFVKIIVKISKYALDYFKLQKEK